jgi:hypothetical protein
MKSSKCCKKKLQKDFSKLPGRLKRKLIWMLLSGSQSGKSEMVKKLLF